ncbi:MAG: hypothetical protein PF517_09040 [Salinivirgaceae bacterium]|nr:hypothetical protein [Salinivirgaceae bacterium]
MPSTIESERKLKNMIENNSYLKVDGRIEDFKAAQESPNHFESFSVQGVKFRYSDYVLDNGFNTTSKKNGPINRNGQLVRIGYARNEYRNVILKLELSDENKSD